MLVTYFEMEGGTKSFPEVLSGVLAGAGGVTLIASSVLLSLLQGDDNSRNPLHFDTIEGGRNSVSDGRTTKNNQSL